MHAVAEAPDFEKSVWETSQVFDHSLQPPAGVIDLDQAEPSAEPGASSSVFQHPLRDAESAIDLD